jgi:hypothetical protein
MVVIAVHFDTLDEKQQLSIKKSVARGIIIRIQMLGQFHNLFFDRDTIAKKGNVLCFLRWKDVVHPVFVLESPFLPLDVAGDNLSLPGEW